MPENTADHLRLCEGCDTIYHLLEESHVAHDANGRYRTAVTLEQVVEERE